MTQTQLKASLSVVRHTCYRPDTKQALTTLLRRNNQQQICGIEICYMRTKSDATATMLSQMVPWTHNINDIPEKQRLNILTPENLSAIALAFAHLSDDPILSGLSLNLFWEREAQDERWGAICRPEGIIFLRRIAEMNLLGSSEDLQKMLNENCIVVLNDSGSAHEELVALNALQDALCWAMVEEDFQRTMRMKGRKPTPRITLRHSRIPLDI